MVVLHTTLPMFSKYPVHAYSHCGGLNEEHSIPVHWGTKVVLVCPPPQMNYNRMFVVQTSTPVPRMHRKPTEHGKCFMQQTKPT